MKYLNRLAFSLTVSFSLLFTASTAPARDSGKSSVTERRMDYRSTRTDSHPWSNDDWGDDDASPRKRPRPRAVLDDEQKGRVDFLDGCLVEYDRHGERSSYAPSCTDEQIDYADEAMRAERSGEISPSEYGATRNPRDDGYSIPKLKRSKSGTTTVKYPNGCYVLYSAKKLRTDSTEECSERQLLRADEAVAK